MTEPSQLAREARIKLFEKLPIQIATVTELIESSNFTDATIQSALDQQREQLSKELFDLKRKCGLCVCPKDFLVTDEACLCCLSEEPNVFEQLQEALKDKERLLNISQRIKCGCFSLDCSKHGAYDSVDIDFYNTVIAQQQKEKE